MIPNRFSFKFTQAALIIILLCLTGHAQAKHLLIYGDSLSAAYGMELEQGWVHLLGKHWQGQHTISNASISGETSRGGLQRLPITLERLKPDLVLIELGANDGLRGSPVSQIRKNLEKMVALCKSANADVILTGISLPPSYGPRYIDQFRAMFVEIAQAHEVNYMDLYQEDFVSTEGYIQADGLHPTAITQPIIRDNVVAYFIKHKLLEQ